MRTSFGVIGNALTHLGLAALVSGTAIVAQATPINPKQIQLGFKNNYEKQAYFTIQSVEVREVETPAATLAASQAPAFQKALPIHAANFNFSPMDAINAITELGGAATGVEQWITLGLKVWDIIVKNKPVATVSSQRLSVLPAAQTDWSQIENWQGPVAKTYELTAKNGFGGTMVKHVYTIAYNYGGTYNGKGQYLANATIIPSNISVSWGYSLNSKVEVGQTVNTSTKDNPIPGVELQLHWSIDTMLKHGEGVESFFIKGDGSAHQVNGPF